MAVKNYPWYASSPGPGFNAANNGRLNPNQLVSVAGVLMERQTGLAFQRMMQAAAAAGVRLSPGGAYRTYQAQAQGRSASPKTFAQAGKSNHGWGQAIDLNGTGTKQAMGPNDPALKWLKANAPRYGFSWERDDEAWHIRYVGYTPGWDKWAAKYGAPDPVVAQSSRTAGQAGSLGSSRLNMSNPAIAAQQPAATGAGQVPLLDFLKKSTQYKTPPATAKGGWKDIFDFVEKAVRPLNTTGAGARAPAVPEVPDMAAILESLGLGPAMTTDPGTGGITIDPSQFFIPPTATPETPRKPYDVFGSLDDASRDVLGRMGVKLPDRPPAEPGAVGNPGLTPAMLAYMRGVGMDLSTIEDQRAARMEEINRRAASTMTDIGESSKGERKNVVADLVQRGVLQSGEGNTRLIGQQTSTQRRLDNVTGAVADQRAGAERDYESGTTELRRQALERLLNEETNQAVGGAQDDAYLRQQGALTEYYKNIAVNLPIGSVQ